MLCAAFVDSLNPAVREQLLHEVARNVWGEAVQRTSLHQDSELKVDSSSSEGSCSRVDDVSPSEVLRQSCVMAGFFRYLPHHLEGVDFTSCVHPPP